MIPAICLFACGHDENPEIPVTIDYQLLNSEGSPSTSFHEGENFVFSLQITNNSDHNILFVTDDMDTETFLEVFSLDKKDENGNEISFGKPYDSIFLIKVYGMTIYPKETLRIEIPWNAYPWIMGVPRYTGAFVVNQEREPLPGGNYTTEFSTPFSFAVEGEEFTSDVKHFRASFSIE